MEKERRARAGICLLLNNDCEGAEEFFSEDSEDRDMAAGKCFVTLINALLSYEPERLEQAVDGLRLLERSCDRQVGWLTSVKNRVFGSSISLTDPDLAERLEEQIILADSQVCVALLTFLQQDITSYFKGGWRLRRAWKVYQHTYTVILDLYKKTFPSQQVPGSEFPSWRIVTHSASDWSVLSSPSQSPPIPRSTSQSEHVLRSTSQSAHVPRSASQSGLDGSGSSQPGLLRSSLSYLSSFVMSSSTPESRIAPEVVARLMSAVSFGFGIFQLCVSLLPPSLLRIIHLLGFDGDRQMGLRSLMFARQGDDMRAPLALLALLWYHTIVRPFLALDGANVQAGVDVASQLYEESKEEFADSALFLFFLGRIQRLKSNIPGALAAYEAAIVKSPQREVQLLCLHEVGWCYLIQLDWLNAFHCFHKLRDKSRWSKLLYTYLAAVSIGASGDTDLATRLFKKLPKLLPEASEARTNIETFIARRMNKMATPDAQTAPVATPETTQDTSIHVSKDKCTLLALELLYLWNALPSSTPSLVLAECLKCKEEPMIGLSSFMQGVIQTYLGELDKAEVFFRRTLDERKDILATPEQPDSSDDHVTAFTALELATLLLQRPNGVEEGKALLTETREKYTGYDFENKVTIRIHAALRKVELKNVNEQHLSLK